ncbi:hypothetical protein Ocin01_03021 [Orchesella cincta]|uniref:Uncharacterized protein n=1 Tax=Orchesella cincta TaxID=48709 RepID=A0A1D2NF81_ORCCI|nr:hypothetical protein Ocin01_03021 [Orchesella cincta]
MAGGLFGIPKKIINFIRESGLYILFIPLLIILPLLMLAFNAGKLIGGLGWGWGRSLSTVENGIVGYFKSPAWQKVAETLMDEHVFDRVMKSLEDFRKDCVVELLRLETQTPSFSLR